MTERENYDLPTKKALLISLALSIVAISFLASCKSDYGFREESSPAGRPLGRLRQRSGFIWRAVTAKLEPCRGFDQTKVS
jgi:hypothetical protein